MPSSALSYRLCLPEEYRDALTVLYGRVDRTWREVVVDDAYEQVKAGGIDLSGLWIALRGRRVRGVFLTQTLPGRAAAVWAPEFSGRVGRSAILNELVREALNDLKSRGVRMVQGLLDPTESTARPGLDLTAAGVPRVTDLAYLERSASDPIPVAPTAPRLEWAPFSSATEAAFRRTLEQSYVDSLDMPELESLRSLDDVVEGHTAAGRFEPSRWWLGRVPGDPDAAAVLILAEIPEKPAWEVAYLGLTPPARGRGIGRSALAHAVELARPNVGRLELAVDERNAPAVRLYRSTGFTRFDRRAVHLAVL